MRVSKEQAAANRSAILRAASRLFRKRGIDGVGVAEIAKEAGLTHGALYAHFRSKDELVAESFADGFERNMAAIRAHNGDREQSFEEHLSRQLSTQNRDRLEAGCPLTASASEIARHGTAVCESFTAAFEAMVTTLEDSLEPEIPTARRRRLAIATVAAQIGAVAISRAIAKADTALADEILEAVRKTAAASHQIEAVKLGS